MSKTAMIRSRMEPALKTQVEGVLKKLGLSVSDAINLFYHQIKLRQGLPFNIELPNKETRKTFNQTDQGKELVQAENAKDMFKKLGI